MTLHVKAWIRDDRDGAGYWEAGEIEQDTANRNALEQHAGGWILWLPGPNGGTRVFPLGHYGRGREVEVYTDHEDGARRCVLKLDGGEVLANALPPELGGPARSTP